MSRRKGMSPKKTANTTKVPCHDVTWLLKPQHCRLLLDDAKRRKSATVRLYFVGDHSADYVEADIKIRSAPAYRARGTWQLLDSDADENGDYEFEVTISCADISAALSAWEQTAEGTRAAEAQEWISSGTHPKPRRHAMNGGAT